MPFGDRRGPYGEGAGSGRGLGFCSGYDSPGYRKSFPRMGGGRGRCFNLVGSGRGFGFFGRGRGSRNMFYATGLPGWARYSSFQEFEQIPEIEEEFLSKQVSFLENQLEAIKKRLSEITEEKERK
jgi:hypothetical protein